MRTIAYASLPWILCFTVDAMAQSSTVSAGGDAEGAGSVSWTVGQVVQDPQSGSGGSLSVGVQQPYVIINTGVDDVLGIDLQLNVAPNPTRASVRLLVDTERHQGLQYELLGLDGQRIHTDRIRGTETPIDMEHLASGTYLLRVYSDQRTMRSVRIIKTN